MGIFLGWKEGSLNSFVCFFSPREIIMNKEKFKRLLKIINHRI